MYGFEKAKETLEFERIVNWIAERCVTENGRARLRAVQPFTDEIALQQALDEVRDMRDVLKVEGGFPIWNFVDVRVLLNKIEPADSFLEIKEFLGLQNLLELVREVLAFRQKMEDKYPHLQEILKQLKSTERLLQQIQFTIEPSGKIYDNASPELKTIRKEIQQIDNEIHIRLERLLKKYAEFLQEEYVTLRDGRFVLPVREFSVNKVPGIVHGQSASGQTYFIEPMPIVDLNNQLQKLHAAEKKEEIKILKQLSRLVKELRNELLVNFSILVELDVLQAKAKYANEFNCSAPDINAQFFVELVQAYHPILLKLHPTHVVPLNVNAGKDFNILVISGPNAGGKTVALKTVGLIQLLFQCGFHVPVGEGSRLPIVKRLFTVIGDDQSIENDLSTFSSHIQSIKHILEQVDEHSLTLIDEIGSGTEPSVGAALAIAVLERLNKSGIISLVTTHQNQLKVFATETDGVENAAMLFDMQHLTPLFTMEIGIPGSSYTFEICKRLGLDESIIQRAQQIAGSETFKLDRILSDLSEKSQKYLKLAQELSIKQSELDSLLELYHIRSETLKKQMKKAEKEAKRQAAQLLADVNRQIEKTIKEIRESQGERQVIKKARQNMDQLRKKLEAEEAPVTGTVVDLNTLKEGQTVRSRKFNFKGQISKIFKSKKAVEIDRDGIKITVAVDDLELLDEQQAKERKSSATTSPSPVVNISNEIDLRGLTVDEALAQLESFLDKARLSSWQEIRIVHGKGTGALRQAVHQYLKKVPFVKTFRLGRWGEGDTGVTVVTLQ